MNDQKPLATELVVALDIGTTKVCAIAGRKNEHGKLEILGVGKVDSIGVMRGVVTNIEKTVNAISEAIQAAERASKAKFSRVHVGIAGQHIKSLQHRGILTRDNDHTEISQKDITRLVNDMYKLVLPPGDKILPNHIATRPVKATCAAWVRLLREALNLSFVSFGDPP